MSKSEADATAYLFLGSFKESLAPERAVRQHSTEVFGRFDLSKKINVTTPRNQSKCRSRERKSKIVLNFTHVQPSTCERHQPALINPSQNRENRTNSFRSTCNINNKDCVFFHRTFRSSSVETSMMNKSMRILQENIVNENGRAVLTVLYMAVFCLCFIVPVFYYFRLHWEERRLRRLRALEIAALVQSLQESEDPNREESLAARRKYREERKAQINQLFTPVRATLTEEHFPHLREENNGTYPTILPSLRLDSDIDEEANGTPNSIHADEEQKDVETGDVEAPNTKNGNENLKTEMNLPSRESDDDDDLLVEIPEPGLFMNHERKLRMVPNVCTICLCNYEIGSDIVWSSNLKCEHAFHLECIEEWLMNQREGPLCPCCRRDFIIDPYDLEGEEYTRSPQNLDANLQEIQRQDDMEAVGDAPIAETS